MAGRKTARKVIEAAKVLELYAAGKTYRDIDEQYAIPRDSDTMGKWNAGRLLNWAVREVMPDSLLKHARNIELQRLQDMHRAVWMDAITGDQDAIATVLKLMERRTKLLGLDSPTKMSSTTTIRFEDVRELSEDELLAIAAGSGGGGADTEGGA